MSGYPCPHCKKPIYDEEAILCLYCGESLERTAGFMGRLRYPRHRVIIIILIMLILLSFAILMVK
jgi:hypothetical protein